LQLAQKHRHSKQLGKISALNKRKKREVKAVSEKKQEKYLVVSEVFWMQFLLFSPPVQWMEFAPFVAFRGVI
jgi:hypothetical protein